MLLSIACFLRFYGPIDGVGAIAQIRFGLNVGAFVPNDAFAPFAAHSPRDQLSTSYHAVFRVELPLQVQFLTLMKLRWLPNALCLAQQGGNGSRVRPAWRADFADFRRKKLLARRLLHPSGAAIALPMPSGRGFSGRSPPIHFAVSAAC